MTNYETQIKELAEKMAGMNSGTSISTEKTQNE